MKKTVLLILIIASAHLVAKPTSEYPLRHHVIIALDRAGCDSWIGVSEVGQKILRLLNDDTSQLTEQGDGKHLERRRLFEPGDYLSVVGFRINETQGDMSVFANPMYDGASKMAWRSYSPGELYSIFGKGWWQTAVQPYNPGNGKSGYSLVSVAKAYALAALKSDGQFVNRTFLILVTDKQFNGNDFYLELQAFIDTNPGITLTPQKIFSKCYEVEQNYVIKYISTQDVWDGNSISPKGYVDLYEYMPLQLNFTLPTVINVPTHLVAKLKRDGSYSLELPVSWQGGDSYRLLHLAAFPIYADKVSYDTPDNATCIDSLKEQAITFDVPSDRSAKYVEIRAWLNFIDGFYNATLMSPEEESIMESGRDGLNHLIPIEYESPETILGIPISRLIWPPFVEDQHRAALIWRVVLGLLFFAGLIVFIRWLRKPRYYTPHNINWPNASS